MPGLNKRSVLNMNILQLNRDNPFINFIKPGGFYYNYRVDIAQIDANGYAIDNSQVATLGAVLSVVLLPSSANYSGAYVLKWTGTGTVYLDQGYAWTYNAGASTGATEVGGSGGGRFSGTNPRIVVTPVGLPASGGGFTITIQATDPSNTNDYIRDLRFYMIGDETDLNAGKVFRAGWKNTIIDLNPGCIRFLNWTGGSATNSSNWSSQISPGNVSYVHSYAGLVPYGLGTITPLTNLITVGSATGMPVTMKHGEIVQIGLSGTATVANSRRVISGITNANPGVVTSNGHGFANGQKVVIQMGQGRTSAFHQLHYKVCTVAGATANTFQLSGINTSTYGTFAGGGDQPGAAVCEYISMNVGARGEYPVLNLNGYPITHENGAQFADTGYDHFIFDKYLVGNRDTGPGAWVCYNANAIDYYPHQPGVPLEVCVAMVNELNAMKTSGGAINMWICTPPRAMMSVDPDYTSAENWAVKAVDRCLNGGGGWAGLTANAALMVEYTNETWNTAFTGSNYASRCGQLRYDAGGGATPFTESASDINSFAVIRSIVMCQDLATAYPTEIASGRLIRVAAGQGVYGIAVGGSGVNEDRVWANVKVLADAWNVGGTNAYTKFETFAWASYFNAEDGGYAWYSNLPTYTANWIAAVGSAAKEAVCSDWVVNGIRPDATAGTTSYVTRGGQFNTVLGNLSRTAIQYEGGYDWQTIVGPGVANQNQADFLVAVQNSAAWAAEQKAFFTSIGAMAHHYHPAIFIQTTDNKWGYNRPSFNNYAGSVEGGALNLTWTAMGEYNDANEPSGVTAVPLMLALRLRLHA